MLNKRIIPPVVVALVLAAPGTAVAEPASSFTEEPAPVAAPQDLRSPDVRDAAAGVVSSSLAGTTQDLRSPDVRDAARGVQSTEPVAAVTVTREDGFEWASAAIGAAAMLAIVLAIGAAAALVVPRRRLRTPLPH